MKKLIQITYRCSSCSDTCNKHLLTSHSLLHWVLDYSNILLVTSWVDALYTPSPPSVHQWSNCCQWHPVCISSNLFFLFVFGFFPCACLSPSSGRETVPVCPTSMLFPGTFQALYKLTIIMIHHHQRQHHSGAKWACPVSPSLSITSEPTCSWHLLARAASLPKTNLLSVTSRQHLLARTASLRSEVGMPYTPSLGLTCCRWHTVGISWQGQLHTRSRVGMPYTPLTLTNLLSVTSRQHLLAKTASLSSRVGMPYTPLPLTNLLSVTSRRHLLARAVSLSSRVGMLWCSTPVASRPSSPYSSCSSWPLPWSRTVPSYWTMTLSIAFTRRRWMYPETPSIVTNSCHPASSYPAVQCTLRRNTAFGVPCGKTLHSVYPVEKHCIRCTLWKNTAFSVPCGKTLY